MKITDIHYLILIIVIHVFFSCTKEEVPLRETIADTEGNDYKIIRIGPQVWMAENLKTTVFSDGTPIPYLNYDSPAYTVYPVYCWYNNDSVKGEIYGALYNGNTVVSGNLAPMGWHIPDYRDWMTLINSAGGLENILAADSENDFPLDSGGKSGFNAIPAGQWQAGFKGMRNVASFWIRRSPGMLSQFSIYPEFGEWVFRTSFDEPYSSCLSVRCIKDDVPAVKTVPIKEITTSSAVSGTEILANGGYYITAKGVCWSTSRQPTIKDNKTVDELGDDFTVSVSELKDLKANTSYYLRAYATTKLGTGYGSEIEFRTPE